VIGIGKGVGVGTIRSSSSEKGITNSVPIARMLVLTPGLAETSLSREILYWRAMPYNVSPSWIVCLNGVAVGSSGCSVGMLKVAVGAAGVLVFD
jgi:hypothetical protein